jgi:hypothetical protein
VTAWRTAVGLDDPLARHQSLVGAAHSAQLLND